MKPSDPGRAEGKPTLLPRLSWFDVIAQTPALVLDSTVFFLTGDWDHAGPYFLFENARYGLLPSQTLEEIEELYLDWNMREIEHYKAAFLQQVVDARIKSLREMATQQVEKQTLAFLIKELIPYFLALDGELQPLTRLPQTTETRQVNLPASEASPARCALKEVMGRRSLVLDAKLYALVRIKRVRGMDLVVRVGNDCWGIGPDCQFLGEIEMAWTQKLRQNLEQGALEEAPDRMTLLKQMDAELQELVEYLEQTPLGGALAGEGYLYQGRDKGVLRKNGNWVIYLDVPEYVVEDANGTLYRFDATRVGISCKSCQPEEMLAAGRACVLTAYEHMFVNTAAPGASICMVKDPSYFSDLREVALAQAVCTYLHDARQTLMAGHHVGNSFSPYHAITEFGHRRITRQEAEKKKLPIFPYRR